MSDLHERFRQVRKRIADAEKRFNRVPNSVRLLAVTKTWPLDVVRAAAQCGQSDFGENYVQEGVEKIRELNDPILSWHFIGRLQSNKAKDVAEHFSWVHSVTRLEHAQRLARFRTALRTPLNVCIQINISMDARKAGIAPAHALALANSISALPNLHLRGLMALPEMETDFSRQRNTFSQVRDLFDQLCAEGLSLDTLSMGMSGDLEAAIAEGATLVRVGTALFGTRVN